MSKLQKIHFLKSEGAPDPERLIYALRGVCVSLDAAEVGMKASREETNRVAELTVAAAVLSEQLAYRLTSAPPRRVRAKPHLEVVRRA